jgi:hypothetical protein
VDRNRLKRILAIAHEQNPQDFETLLGLQGVGPATIRSLALLAEIIFQAPPSRRDPTAGKCTGDCPNFRGHPAQQGRENGTVPLDAAQASGDTRRWADYAHAHGGKDGTPFPVDRTTYDRNIAVLTDTVRKARLGQSDKLDALRRLSKLGGT